MRKIIKQLIEQIEQKITIHEVLIDSLRMKSNNSLTKSFMFEVLYRVMSLIVQQLRLSKIDKRSILNPVRNEDIIHCGINVEFFRILVFLSVFPARLVVAIMVVDS